MDNDYMKENENHDSLRKWQKLDSDSQTATSAVNAADYATAISHEDEYIERQVTLWQQWHEFLKAARTDADLHDYSAEKHGIVVCGDGIRARDKMDEGAYHSLCSALDSNSKLEFHEIFKEELDRVEVVLDSDEGDMLAAARAITHVSPDSAARMEKLNYLSDILVSVIRNIYMTEANLGHSETILNALVAWPSLQCTLNAVCGETRGLTFFPGEEQLLSMTTQLKANDAGHDDRSYYKADAILRCLNKKTGSNMELLLLETSNAYNNASTKKINFDFHKGICMEALQC
ncbi:hypothetical protein K492DRAFT_45782 [Lichtheimia hyalospora FSU 10163]|nr:hypothetical protein K492DRAFT_45782 [Lichtheimia hyalospora FSU 10163]